MLRVRGLVAGSLALAAASLIQAHGAPGSTIDRAAVENLPRAPRPQWKVEPFYPSGAAEAKLDGRVVLVLRITASGGVGEIGVSSEDPGGYGFGQFAMDAVRQWVYDPKAAGLYRMTVNFRYNLK